MPPSSSRYTVLSAAAEVTAEIERRKSRFLTVMKRAESAEAAQETVDQLRRHHHTARHHCSAWLIGPQRSIQRANDDGEPSGTAGGPMLEALSRADTPVGTADLSDVVVVVVRWFGGTLLGAGGLVSAYSDSVIAVLEQAEAQQAFLPRQRMQQFTLTAPISEAGRWENELRAAGLMMEASDYTAVPGSAVLYPAVPDTPEAVRQLDSLVAALSAGAAELRQIGTDWVDLR